MTELPWQKVKGPDAETVLDGTGFTTTAWADEVLLHPLALTVTEYDPAAKAVMLCVVAPLFHK